jgi:hypothetical protein
LSISRSWTSEEANIKAVVARYKAEDKPTTKEVASELGTTPLNVRYVLQMHLPPEELRAEQALRYSRGKVGKLNPMSGRNGSRHPNYKGSVPDHKGYLTEPDGSGGRVFQHRLVMAQAIGIEKLPSHLEVHHIDGNPLNNSLDNLALVTSKGHNALHHQRPEWSRLTLWEQWESGISRSWGTTPTPSTDS